MMYGSESTRVSLFVSDDSPFDPCFVFMDRLLMKDSLKIRGIRKAGHKLRNRTCEIFSIRLQICIVHPRTKTPQPMLCLSYC